MPDFAVPRFSSADERDRRYGEWMGAGNRLADGMTCLVAGLWQVRRNQEWVTL